jgi:hypothetical protein
MNPDFADYSGSTAILIGVSDYEDPDFPPLPAAANSLEHMRAVLVEPKLCGWPADRVEVLRDPTDVRRVVRQLRRSAQQTTDVFLLYYVGHGTVTPAGELCLTLVDTDPTDPDVTGIEYRRIRGALLDSPARMKVVVLDCCYSGRAIEALADPINVVADSTDTRGVFTVTASDQTAHVVPFHQQASACTTFTGELVNLIRGGIPAAPEMLTLGTIYLHLRQRLLSRGLPPPNQRGTDTADLFAFSRNPAVRGKAISRQVQEYTEPEAPAEDFDPTLYGMPATYDDQGNYVYPEGFDAETGEWREGFEAERDEWEREYEAARSRYRARMQQREKPNEIDARAGAEVAEEDFDPTLYGMPATYDDQGNYVYPEGFDADAGEWREGFEAERDDWVRQYEAARSRYRARMQQLKEPNENDSRNAEPPRGRPSSDEAPGSGSVKVYQLAQELGVESKAVMAKLGEMGEYVRSTSSMIDSSLAGRLREVFVIEKKRSEQQVISVVDQTPKRAKARVYELAQELGVESKAVMAKLGEMGEFVRSASSIIEPRVANKLREEFMADKMQPEQQAIGPVH